MKKTITLFFFLAFNLIFPQTKDFYFAWLTDTHVGGTTGADDLTASINDINKMDSISFFIISGDITEYGSFKQFQMTDSILKKSNKKYYLIPGNHDTKWSESGATMFQKFWGNDRFVFDYNGIKFIGIHQGPRMRMGDGHWAPEDLQWLDSILLTINKEQPVIFITHYPIDESISNWFEVSNRIRNYKLIKILCGHGHSNRDLTFEGLAAVMGRSNLKANKEHGGFNIVKITSDSIYFFERTTLTKTNEPWLVTALFENRITNKKSYKPKPNFELNKNYPNVKVEWKFESKYTITNPPKYYNSSIFFGNAEGKLYSINEKNGNVNWCFSSGSAIYSTPDIYNNKVVFASTNGSIYCLNFSDGELLWECKTNYPIVASPKISNDKVFIGSSENIFRAIDLYSGKLIWEFNEVNGFVESIPLIIDNKIVFGAWDENLYCLNMSDGSLFWKWRNESRGALLSPAACIPVFSDNKIFIVAPDRKTTAIDFNSGKTLWRTGEYSSRETIGISEDRKQIFIRTMNDTILALNPFSAKPEILWSSNLGFGYDINSAQISEHDNVLLYATKNGIIYAVSSKNGELIWKYKSGNSLINTIEIIDKNNFALTNFDGELIKINHK